MNWGKFGFGKPIGKAAGAFPQVIGPGFATYPAAGATVARGFSKAVPVRTVAVAPWGGKGFGKPWGII